MTDYRSELQALVDACESFADPISGHRIPWQTALDRARAALAEPEPEGPTRQFVNDRVATILAQREEILSAFIAKHGFDPESAIQVEQRQEDGTTTWRIEARTTPQPVPVSERLPGPEDCDAQGRCWLCGKVEGDCLCESHSEVKATNHHD